jgi:hypothetical protein
VTAVFEFLVQIVQQQIGEQRRQRTALRRALIARGAEAVLHHPRRQIAADNPQQALVANAPGQTAHHHVVIDPIEKLFEIQIDDDVVAAGPYSRA